MEARPLGPPPDSEGFDLNNRSAKHSFNGAMLMWRSYSVGESLRKMTLIDLQIMPFL